MLTEEQEAIVRYVTSRPQTCTVVRSVAGSGKTLCSFACAERMFQLYGTRTLIVTFSALLKVAGRALCRDKPYAMVESYHSSVSTIFFIRCMNSHDLELFLTQRHAFSPQISLRDVALLVVDEVQDVNLSICALINYYRPFLHPQHSLLLVGDENQAVFAQLQGSDVRYLMEPENYFGNAFHRLSMSLSFRVPSNIAEWLNRCLPTAIPIRSARSGGRVIHETFPFWSSNVPPHILAYIKDYITQHGPESVAILSKSVKVSDSHPVRQIMRACANARWIVLDGSFQEDDTLLHGKAISATPWKFKGRDKPLIIAVGLDESLEKHHDARLSFCLAEVMCTRASDTLIVLSNAKERPFFTMRNDTSPNPKINRLSKNTPITELYRFVPYQAKLDTMPFEIVKRIPNCAEMSLPIAVEIKGLWEPASKVFHEALEHKVRDSLTDSGKIWEHYLTEASKDSILLPVESWFNDGHRLLLDTLLLNTRDLLPDGESFQAFRKDTRDGLTAESFLVFDDQTCITLCTNGHDGLQHAVLTTYVMRASKAMVIYPCIGEARRTWAPYPEWLTEMRARLK